MGLLSRFGRKKDAGAGSPDVQQAIQQSGTGNLANTFVINVGQEALHEAIQAALAEHPNRMIVVASSSRPSTKGFLDRDSAIRELVSMVQSRQHNIIGITDHAGNGKSTFVVRVTEVLANLRAFPRSSWIRLQPGFTFDQLSSRLLAEAGIQDAIPDPTERIDRIVAAIQEPVLIVLDAFEHMLDAEGHCQEASTGRLLRALSSSQHNAQIIITSRRRPIDVEPSISAYAPFPPNGPLRGLDTEFAVQLLRQQGITGEDDVLQNAARRLGGNPKALELLAHHLRRHYDGDASVLSSRPQLLASGVSGLVSEIVQSLSDAERLIVQRASVLRRAVPTEAFIVLSEVEPEQAEPLVTGLREQSILDRDEDRPLWSLHTLLREQFSELQQPHAHLLAAAYYDTIEPPTGMQPRDLEDVYMLLEGANHAIEAGDWHFADTVMRSQRFGTDGREDLSHLLTRRGFAQTALQVEQDLARSVPDSEVEAWANAQGNLGNAYSRLPTGNRAQNLQQAFVCYENALRVHTDQNFPEKWALGQNNLGNTYTQLPTGDRAQNLAQAIACFQNALRVRTEQDFPAEWATTQSNLGAAYARLPTGDRAQNLAQAIACFQNALRVRTEQDFPAEWAMTQNNLGGAYARLPTGDRAQNLAQAIACYQNALRVRIEQDFPAEWAGTQNNLGNAYAQLPTGDQAENLQLAITCFQDALRVYSEQDFPEDHAVTQRNLEQARNLLKELEEST
jgi:tetratricopeptide (TPR) repeat protein